MAYRLHDKDIFHVYLFGTCTRTRVWYAIPYYFIWRSTLKPLLARARMEEKQNFTWTLITLEHVLLPSVGTFVRGKILKSWARISERTALGATGRIFTMFFFFFLAGLSIGRIGNRDRRPDAPAVLPPPPSFPSVHDRVFENVEIKPAWLRRNGEYSTGTLVAYTPYYDM